MEAYNLSTVALFVEVFHFFFVTPRRGAHKFSSLITAGNVNILILYEICVHDPSSLFIMMGLSYFLDKVAEHGVLTFGVSDEHWDEANGGDSQNGNDEDQIELCIKYHLVVPRFTVVNEWNPKVCLESSLRIFTLVHVTE
ncbi:uncharacterized protein LOC113473220 [Diaphorina citri]|uniref:Uncharacterized protein LOC113473220 n=1 Tax=Diaphorina citri TaxID=121845 RepID=A0A3Q0JPH5_DIACI|nr:uncharacterized protein LOC113473220 [Diaphorina citri]